VKAYDCITGAAGGLGKAFAVECACRGWDLFITDLSEEALASLAGGLSTAYGINVIYRTCDLTDPAARIRLFDYMNSKVMRFWSLINVAGLDYEGGPSACLTACGWCEKVLTRK
jgi:short-subunit dehydrogenase